MNTKMSNSSDVDAEMNSYPDVILEALENQKKFLNNDICYHLSSCADNEFLLLSKIHMDLMFVKNDDLISKLSKDYDLPEDVFCWFVSFNDINSELRIIESKGIEIEEPLLYYYTLHHLHIKFCYSLIRFLERKSKLVKPTSAGVESLKNLKKRIKYHNNSMNSKARIDELDVVTTHYYENVSKLGNPKGNVLEYINNGIDVLRGDTKQLLLIPMLNQCFQYKSTMSLSKFYGAIYGYFQIILQDHNLTNYLTSDDGKRLKKILQ